MAELIPDRDPYAFWRAGLAGITAAVQDGHPQAGFYRLRSVKGGPWLPVAIWQGEEDGTMSCIVGDDDRRASDVWLSCARFPVTEADYRHAVEHGSWPGALDESGPATIGDNQPPMDEASAIAADVEDRAAEIKAWLDGRRIESQADADRAEAYIARMTSAGKAAEAQHKAEKAPHLEAGRAVDTRWKPIISSAAEAVRALKAALTPFLNARAAEKRAEAAKAIASGADVARADVTARTSGTHGRKISLRTVRRAEIKDYAKALEFFADHPEVKALVQKLASKVASVGGTVPGVETVEEQVAA